MGVTADQRAILELLLNHGVDYDTIGAVLSTGPAGARDRARAALSSLAGDEAELDPGLADFLLGRAVASEQTRTVQALTQDAEANALARRVADALQAEFEGIEPPHIPSLHRGAPANGDRPIEVEERPKPRSRRRRLLRIAIATVVAAAVALAVTLALPIEDTTDDAEPPAEEAPPLSAIEDRIPLRAPDGGGASGEAVIGLTSPSKPYLALDLQGVAPAPERHVHLLWIDVAGGSGLPMPPPIPVGRDGDYRDRLGLPVELVAALDQGQSLEVITIAIDELRELRRGFDANVGTDLAAAVDELPERPGATVLEGDIPALATADAAGAG